MVGDFFPLPSQNLFTIALLASNKGQEALWIESMGEFKEQGGRIGDSLI